MRSRGGDNFLTSASSVFPVPALSPAAAPAPASAVAPPTGAPSAALVALTFAVGVAAAFPVAIKVTALALFTPPVVTIPVWLMSEREYILVFNGVETEEDDRACCSYCLILLSLTNRGIQVYSAVHPVSLLFFLLASSLAQGSCLSVINDYLG